jgi:HD-GYP domain-containing protein (c-di-GMP phosphodiesterase class II)
MPHIDLEKIIATLGNVARILRDKPDTALSELRKISNQIDQQIPYRDGHSARVCDYSLKMGNALGFSDEQLVNLEAAALLHDFGKICVEENLLRKPKSLQDEERSEVEKHVLRGYHILSGFVDLDEALKGVRSHHEHYNGLGYPQGLTDGNIPLYGRIIAVADAYDAMTSDRPYRKAKSKKIALEELKRYSGKQFDPHIVDIFMTVI